MYKAYGLVLSTEWAPRSGSLLAVWERVRHLAKYPDAEGPDMPSDLGECQGFRSVPVRPFTGELCSGSHIFPPCVPSPCGVGPTSEPPLLLAHFSPSMELQVRSSSIPVQIHTSEETKSEHLFLSTWGMGLLWPDPCSQNTFPGTYTHPLLFAESVISSVSH